MTRRKRAAPGDVDDHTSIVLWLMVLLVFVPLTAIHVTARLAPAEQEEPSKRPGSRAN